tara:strand:- start:122457 stop:123329 length:873 start_codon:yes stop_codon:yes gene_type:complete
MPDIAVTGATGRVGGALWRRLLAQGVSARALVRNPTAFAVRYPDSVAHPFSFEDIVAMTAAMQGVNRIFLVTPDEDPRAQLQYERNFAIAAQRAGVKHVIKLSAYLAGAQPPISFGRYQRQSEQELETRMLTYTHLRPAFFMQSLSLFAKDIRSSGKLMAPAKSGEIAFVHIDDIAAVAAKLLTQGGFENEALTLTGPQAYSFDHVADRLSLLLEKRVRHVAPPKWLAKFVLPFQAGMSRHYAALIVEMMASFERGSEATVSDAVYAVTGEMPRSLDSYLEQNLQLFSHG